MTAQTLAQWEAQFALFLNTQSSIDPAHGRLHIDRVVANARALAAIEGADLAVVLPAAWLHDCVTAVKTAPDRAGASRRAAATAGVFLRDAGYPAHLIPAIEHAIAAHSFSAQIPPETLEARVVQDADRLDALGAIGIARTLAVGGALDRPLYDAAEPFPDTRIPDDNANTLDHFYVKLLTLAGTMQTAAGRAEAHRRTTFMRQYLAQLATELAGLNITAGEKE